MALVEPVTTVSIGLVSYRDTVVNESYVQGCWPLGELYGTSFLDIGPFRRKATLVSGTGATRGVPTDITGGGLGLDFDGVAYLQVSDDGVGGLSLAGGSIDVSFLIKTSHNSGTNRCIVQKMATDATGNGYSASLVSGAIRFRLQVAGVEIFNFDRGSIADGAWHLVHCYYDPDTQEARTFIDGVQSGATVATTNTDPLQVNVALRIGAWTDGSGCLIGTLAYVMVGREGRLDLSVDLQAARTWTDLTADLSGKVPIELDYGFADTDVLSTLGDLGSLAFGLINSSKNSSGLQGRYSPGHANALSGFVEGAPVQLTLAFGGTTYYKFRGQILDITPIAGVRRERTVYVTCGDWMAVADSDRLGSVATVTNTRSSDVVRAVIDRANRPPVSVNVGTGLETFPFAIDSAESEDDTLTSEIGRVCRSEFAQFAVIGDTTRGGVVTFWPRSVRQSTLTSSATFDDTMSDLVVERAVGRIMNVARMTVHPRKVDAAATTVLGALETDQPGNLISIPPGESRIVEFPYVDPSQTAVRVGGTELVTPVATTDYMMHTAASGGSDITGSLTVTPAERDGFGGNLCRALLTNTHPSATGFITKFQIRGKGIYHYREYVLEFRDEDSVRRFGPQVVALDLPYITNTVSAATIGNFIVRNYSQPLTVATSITIPATASATYLTQALAREPGDLIKIGETMTGLATSDTGYIIQRIRLTIRRKNRISCTWTLAPAPEPTLLVAYSGPQEGLHSFDGGPLVLPFGSVSDYVFTYSRTGDTVNVRGIAGGGGGGNGIADSSNSAGGGGGGGGEYCEAGVDVTVASAAPGYYTGKVGAGGAAGRPGDTGGTTEYRVAGGSVLLRLIGGTGGGGTLVAHGGGAGGTGGTGGTRVSGGAGGAGGNEGAGGNNGTAAASGAGGGGGGGSASSQGGTGGAGVSQAGGAGGSAGNNGTSASGFGGSTGTSSPGGGGGGGGGASLAGAYRGGGGGGGAGARASDGGGGAGGDGVLILTKV